jgi:zinc transport system substrate-binding protein
MILMFLRWGKARGGGALVGIGTGVLVVVLGGVVGCGADTGASPGAAEKSSVITAFYPLQYATERIAGSHANVTNLTKPGAEPHDLELTPRDVAALEEAGLVVYLKGFQPAVDDSVAQVAGDHSLDVSAHADLTGGDPHFWLDPVRLADVGDGIAERLSALDPDRSRDYERNAAKLRGDLEALDQEFATSLASCANRDLVTSHTAFGYLAARYDFRQHGIAGLSPEREPSPAELSAAATFVRRHDVRTVYYETLVDPSVAATLATETGAEASVLDPLEGLTDESAGTDYPSVMRSNLAALKKGQNC